MANNFLGEIRLMSFTFAPRGWVTCDGQTLSISQHSALFSLLGTTFGGNGVNTFMLPDLRGKVAMHPGPPFVQGGTGGSNTVALTSQQIPTHVHNVSANSKAATTFDPTGALPATSAPAQIYSIATRPTLVPMNAAMVATAGGGQGHSNQQPFLCISFVIATSGLFPSRN